MSEWQPFTPTWTNSKYKWWQFIKRYRYSKAPKPMAVYRKVGKVVEIKIGDSHE